MPETPGKTPARAHLGALPNLSSKTYVPTGTCDGNLEGIREVTAREVGDIQGYPRYSGDISKTKKKVQEGWVGRSTAETSRSGVHRKDLGSPVRKARGPRRQQFPWLYWAEKTYCQTYRVTKNICN